MLPILTFLKGTSSLAPTSSHFTMSPNENMSHSVYVFLDTVLACSGLIQLTVPLALETLPSVLSLDFFAIPKSISLATPF